MLSIVCSSQNPDKNFKDHVIKMCGLPKDKIEFLFYENKNEFSLTNIYNKGLIEAKNDIIIFLHHDLIVETHQIGKKIIKHFDKNPEYGIIGLAGTRVFVDPMWWKKNMMGIVNHEHEGKRFTSKYSNDIGDNINEAIVLDGVFFAVNRKKIKLNFDERFTGFHFYDISFCFRNYLEGVKIGVITNIRICHKSIGIMPEIWYQNHKQFEELYGEHLPAKVKRIFHSGEKLKVLIGCLNFNSYTGSELYVFELAKELIKQGCEVSISSTIGNPLAQMAKQLGIKLYSLQEPPGFKLGDGHWLLKTVDGEIPSQENTLYKVSDVRFDVMHLNHKPVTEHLLRLYPDVDTICSIHSEVISLEEPIVSQQIKKYIAIRPEIKNYIVDKFGINPELVDVIYNPIDGNRFKISNNKQNRNKKRTLFVGTIDYLRKEAIQDLINSTKENNEELWIVGKKNDTYLDSMINGQNHVKYFPPTQKTEEFIHQCDIVAGILLGRTTIEGWLCGKDAIIYDVDNSGNIKSKTLHQPPSDVEKFRSDFVTKQIIEEYKSILN